MKNGFQTIDSHYQQWVDRQNQPPSSQDERMTFNEKLEKDISYIKRLILRQTNNNNLIMIRCYICNRKGNFASSCCSKDRKSRRDKRTITDHPKTSSFPTEIPDLSTRIPG